VSQFSGKKTIEGGVARGKKRNLGAGGKSQQHPHRGEKSSRKKEAGVSKKGKMN